MIISNLRQSDNWHEYLKSLGWKTEITSKGTKVSLLKTFLGFVTKIQRPENLDKQDLDEIENICKKYNTLFIKIEPTSPDGEELLKNNGYHMSPHPFCPPSTMFLDLKKSEKELWESISRSGKYSIRRAKREGSSIEIIREPSMDEVSELYAVVTETKKKKKFYVQPESDVQKQFQVFGKNSFYARVKNSKGELMGGKFFAIEKNTVTFLLGGTTELGRKGKWGYDLMWESLLYFKNLGCEYMDLEGIDDDRFPAFTRDWGGFSHFKEKFGGEIIRYPPPYIKYRKVALKILSKLIPLPL